MSTERVERLTPQERAALDKDIWENIYPEGPDAISSRHGVPRDYVVDRTWKIGATQSGAHKLTHGDMRNILALLEERMHTREIAEKFDVKEHVIQRIKAEHGIKTRSLARSIKR